ncbi:hypothetical protein [Oscillatoria salina]|uniref:hypothetical protein n=1 Tax=Oscillatoria salina TaxID=331517 RepID=UPI001CCB15E6|nr:hypothetical protein [Oscillatoria salina]MBZ8182454.1 hypothetical protein [Oscillatoria salina IIICB1]
MNQADIEAALQAAFRSCEIAFSPLTDQQKQILLQIVLQELSDNVGERVVEDVGANPLDELTPEERLALLEFVQRQEEANRPWKITLLNDWLHDRDSGSVQFIRDRYGTEWLNRVKTVHLAKYFERENFREGLKLKVGDRIEVSNGLWEWVQDEGPCQREWFPCNVIGVSQVADNDCTYTNCAIRFDNGAEFEIQGIDQWNATNWRWLR